MIEPAETRTFNSGHARLYIGMQKDIQSCSLFRVSQMKRGLAFFVPYDQVSRGKLFRHVAE